MTAITGLTGDDKLNFGEGLSRTRGAASFINFPSNSAKIMTTQAAMHEDMIAAKDL
jgi:hypothetical protein